MKVNFQVRVSIVIIVIDKLWGGRAREVKEASFAGRWVDSDPYTWEQKLNLPGRNTAGKDAETDLGHQVSLLWSHSHPFADICTEYSGQNLHPL
jgi:hypothetical protein